METTNTFEAVLIQFLLELARGHWNAVLPADDGPDATTKPHTLLNQLTRLLGDELRNLIFHKAFVNPHAGYRFIEYGLLLLNKDLRIVGLSTGASAFLEQSPAALYRTDFISLLEAESVTEFSSLVDGARVDGTPTGVAFELLFRHPRIPLKATGFIAPVLYGKWRLAVSLFGLQPVDVLREGEGATAPVRIRAVQEVYDFIAAHREGPLPSARELARRFGTNEFELKKDFRLLFGRSIYQAYTQMRLEGALGLIKTTDLPLATIASHSGFEDYSSFAKAFRKRYGCSPNEAKGRL